MPKLVHFNLPAFMELTEHKGYSVDTPYWTLCTMLNASLLDRTGTLDTPFKYQTLSPLPAYHDDIELDLTALINRRAKEIIKRSECEDRPIIVYWSGGIDSTLVLASLLYVGVDVTKIIVRLNDFSINEHRVFYQNHIKGKIKEERITTNVKTSLTLSCLQNNLVVTGETGDQIMGSSLYKEFMPRKLDSSLYHSEFIINGAPYKKGTYLLFEEPWEPIAEAFFCREFPQVSSSDQAWAREITRALKPLVAKCPFRIKTCFDLFWWLNFTCKWQGVLFRFFDHLEMCENEHGNLIHFFDDIHIQKWAINPQHHNMYKIKKSLVNRCDPFSGETSMKWAFKQYIRDNLDHDDQYFCNKLKYGSLPFNGGTHWWFRDEAWKIIGYSRTSSPHAFDKLYSDQYDGVWEK